MKQEVFSEEVVRRFLQTFRFPPMASDCESSDVWMSTTSSKKFAPGLELFGVNFSARSCMFCTDNVAFVRMHENQVHCSGGAERTSSATPCHQCAFAMSKREEARSDSSRSKRRPEPKYGACACASTQLAVPQCPCAVQDSSCAVPHRVSQHHLRCVEEQIWLEGNGQ